MTVRAAFVATITASRRRAPGHALIRELLAWPGREAHRRSRILGDMYRSSRMAARSAGTSSRAAVRFNT